MNSCFHEANRMTREEAHAVLRDPDAPECLCQAAVWVLSHTEPEKVYDAPLDASWCTGNTADS